jgi:hypothetical protein
MLLRDLEDARKLFSALKGTFVGIGMSAYPRMTPAQFIEPYHVIALRKTGDLPLLRKRAVIFCLEEVLGHFVAERGFNSASLLSSPHVKTFLKNLPDPKYLLLYQSYPEIEELALREGWHLLANPASLRLRADDRAFFLQMLADLDLPSVPGNIFPVNQLYTRDYEFWASEIGLRFVIQFPEIRQGGGKGTFFIKAPSDYRRLQLMTKGGTWRGVTLKSVSVHQFVEGIPVSIALCLTGHGVLSSPLQRQLIDLPYCKGVDEDGVFCGHSWGQASWPPSMEDEAQRQAHRIGWYMARMGYRGILGIDFLIQKDMMLLYPVECNPRLTGAFPLLSQLHMRESLIPMDVFHMLEFMALPYQMDHIAVNSGYEKAISGSHVILFSLSARIPEDPHFPGAGLYEYHPDSRSILFVGSGSDYRDILSDRQFIITDGPPDTGGKAVDPVDPLYRICRLLFPGPVVDERGVFSTDALFVADWIYGENRR